MLRVPKVQEPRLRHCQASKESRFRQELPPRHRHTAIDIIRVDMENLGVA